MPIHFDEFRKMNWNERVVIFNAISSGEKADLVRTQVDRWLEGHRTELNPAQIAYLEECIAHIEPRLYEHPKDAALVQRLKELEQRGLPILTRDQMREALTLHWDMVCHIRPPGRDNAP